MMSLETLLAAVLLPLFPACRTAAQYRTLAVSSTGQEVAIVQLDFFHIDWAATEVRLYVCVENLTDERLELVRDDARMTTAGVESRPVRQHPEDLSIPAGELRWISLWFPAAETTQALVHEVHLALRRGDELVPVDHVVWTDDLDQFDE